MMQNACSISYLIGGTSMEKQGITKINTIVIAKTMAREMIGKRKKTQERQGVELGPG